MTPVLAQAEAEHIAAATGWRTHRVQVFDTSMGKVIAKGHRPRRGPLRYWALSAIARALGTPMLRAVPMQGGAESQSIEIRRLQALHAAGAPVPRVVHVATDHFVMTWLGGNQLADVLNDRHADGLRLWREAGQAMLDLHASDQYLSQSFGRNMIIDDGNDQARFAGMIDFEDDPLQVMDLPDAQTRDWLIFLQSTAHYLRSMGWQAEADAELDGWIAAESDAVQTRFSGVFNRLAWLRHLSERRRFGRDVMAIQAVAAMAQRWRERQR